MIHPDSHFADVRPAIAESVFIHMPVFDENQPVPLPRILSNSNPPRLALCRPNIASLRGQQAEAAPNRTSVTKLARQESGIFRNLGAHTGQSSLANPHIF